MTEENLSSTSRGDMNELLEAIGNIIKGKDPGLGHESLYKQSVLILNLDLRDRSEFCVSSR